MAFRFRRTLKVAPGIRLNLTKKGASVRVGPRGAGVTMGTSGTTVSAGLPGTGLHASKKLSNAARAASKTPTTPHERADPDFALVETPARETARLGFLGWTGVIVWVGIGFWLIGKFFG
jgi:hypothetical protein